MLVFLNGEFVPEERAVVSVFDRSFLYGDGLFESMLVRNGRPFRWAQHLERLEHGAEFLKIRLPFSASALQGFAERLIRENQMPECLLRLTLSRGVGIRGYSPRGADRPFLVMTQHQAQPVEKSGRPGWGLVVAPFRLPANEPLAQFKTCNKLAQILARAHADAAGADEALLLNTEGFVVEGASSNLFWVKEGTVVTPPLASGILAGVTRFVVLEICKGLALPTGESSVTPLGLKAAEGVFVTLSTAGIVTAVSLDGQPLAQSPMVERLARAYDELVREECRQDGMK